MKIPGLELVKDVRKPYPVARQTMGLSVVGDNPELPSRLEITLLDTTYEDGMHSICISVVPYTESADREETALTYANAALKLLDLPDIAELDSEEGGLTQELDAIRIGVGCGCSGAAPITEEQYNDYYERIMRSEYVQGAEESFTMVSSYWQVTDELFDEFKDMEEAGDSLVESANEEEITGPFIAFVLDPVLRFEEERMRKIYWRDYPWKQGDESMPMLAPIVNQAFNLCGMLSEEPYDAYLFAGAVQNIDDAALPHPIPNFEDVEGFYVSFNRGAAPDCIGVNVSESVRRLGLYEVQVVLTACPYPRGSEEEIEWASERADEALAMLNLPDCEEIDARNDEYPEPLGIFMHPKGKIYVVEFEITREEFEEMYVDAARSDFVQWDGRARVFYMLNEKAGVDFERARKSYVQFYERVRETLEPDEVMAVAPPQAGTDIRALVDIDQNLIGFGEPTQNGFMSPSYVE